jgi:competence protein ComGD
VKFQVAAHNQEGFTLIETMVVLMIVTLILPISLRQYARVSERQQLNAFVSQLEEVIHFAQMTAIAEDRYVVVELHNNTHEVEVVLGVKQIKKMDVNQGISFENGTRGLTLKFTSNGTLVGNAGSIFIKTEHFTEKVMFLLGQGRFYVEQVV